MQSPAPPSLRTQTNTHAHTRKDSSESVRKLVFASSFVHRSHHCVYHKEQTINCLIQSSAVRSDAPAAATLSHVSQAHSLVLTQSGRDDDGVQRM